MNSSRKGADGERELAAILEAEGFQMERGGTESFGTAPDLSGLPGIHIEVKRVEKLNIFTAMAQAIRDAARFRDGYPTVFHRRNRKPWLVTMLLSDWLRMYKAALNSKTKARTSADFTKRLAISEKQKFVSVGEFEKGE
jgi:Holliday junction resolvase